MHLIYLCIMKQCNVLLFNIFSYLLENKGGGGDKTTYKSML